MQVDMYFFLWICWSYVSLHGNVIFLIRFTSIQCETSFLLHGHKRQNPIFAFGSVWPVLWDDFAFLNLLLRHYLLKFTESLSLCGFYLKFFIFEVPVLKNYVFCYFSAKKTPQIAVTPNTGALEKKRRMKDWLGMFHLKEQ